MVHHKKNHIVTYNILTVSYNMETVIFILHGIMVFPAGSLLYDKSLTIPSTVPLPVLVSDRFAVRIVPDKPIVTRTTLVARGPHGTGAIVTVGGAAVVTRAAPVVAVRAVRNGSVVAVRAVRNDGYG